jgi:hypothetical protein
MTHKKELSSDLFPSPDLHNPARRNFLQKAGVFGAGALALNAGGSFAQSVYNPNATELVQFFDGGLPVMITAPHGGTELVFGIPARNNIARPVENFSFYGAIWTYEIALRIMEGLAELAGGKRPYMVMCLAHRRYLDVNREESDAYEAILNAPRIYWEYHDSIRNYINRMKVLYGSALVVEITGQPDNSDIIMRRTLNGNAVRDAVREVAKDVLKKGKDEGLQKFDAEDLEKRYAELTDPIEKTEYRDRIDDFYLQKGAEFYTGPNSVAGGLIERGYKVDPGLNIENLETESVIAGNYTLQRYGSHTGSAGANVIQLVIGGKYRRTTNYEQTGLDIANAIWHTCQHYGLIEKDLLEK